MLGKVSIVIEKDINGYFAFCPELKGCQTEGDTFDEAYASIKEAIELYLETLKSSEINQILNKEIFTTNYEVAFA